MRETGGVMRPWVCEVPREYREWLGGVEPAWTVLEPGLSEKLVGEPPSEGEALHLAVDLTADELAESVLVQNALVLLAAVAKGDGLTLTARKNLTRSSVATIRDAMVWPGCGFEETWRAGKVLSEDHVQELRLLRALVEMDGLVKHADGRLRTTAYGRAVLKGQRPRLQANLFRNAFWQMSLNLFGSGECGHWPQQQIGMALWALSTTGHRWQDTGDLMRLSVLPDDAVLRNPDWVAPMLFALRVLRPLLWFGLLEYREDSGSATRGSGARRRCSTGSSPSIRSAPGRTEPCTDTAATARPGRAPPGGSSGRHVDAPASVRAVPLARRLRE